MIEAIGEKVIVCGSGPMEETHREQHGEVRWCFKCRKRRRFDYVVLSPTTETGWYWGPVPRIECAECHTSNGDLFPGWSREWEE